MRLLIITQKVDMNADSLGFFHNWVIEFAKNCDRVTVICLKKGSYKLPDNVKILSLGKELGKSRLKYIFNFYRYIWKERNEYDDVFVHMNPEYVVLGGIYWRILGKKVGLWYTHKSIDLKLVIAEKIVNMIFSASKKSFRLKSSKINIVGHGINFDIFKPIYSSNPVSDYHDTEFKILSVSRIAPVKDCVTLINAINCLNKNSIKIQLKIVGSPQLKKDVQYLKDLKTLIIKKKLGDVIRFIGLVPNRKILSFYQQADLFVNMSHTGSLDKSILEAVACKLPILTCNEAALDLIGKYKDECFFKKRDFKDLARKIKIQINAKKDFKNKMCDELYFIALNKHNLKKLIKKIISIYK